MYSKRLQKAIAQYQSSAAIEREASEIAPISVEWKPFIIDPGTSLKGETVEAYCRRRWGGSGWTRSMIAGGRKDGANFSNWQWWPNTLKAHQLVQFLCNEGRAARHGPLSSNVVNQRLFEAQYELGENISDLDTLVDIAKELLTRHGEANEDDGEMQGFLRDLRTHLDGDEGASEVQREIQLGRQRYRISGVPFSVIGASSSSINQRPYGLSGAQSPETLLSVFEELSESD